MTIFVRRGKLYLSIGSGDSRIRISLHLDARPENKKIAQAIEQKIRLDKLLGRFTSVEDYLPGHEQSPSQVSLAEVFQAYLEYKKPRLKIKSIESTYRPILSVLERVPQFGLKDTERFREFLVNSYSLSYGQRIAEFTNSAIRWYCHKHKIEKFAIVPTVDNARISRTSKAVLEDVLTEDEQSRLLNYLQKELEEYTYFLIVSFLLATGCRPSEALGLQWDAVDLVNRRVAFRQGLVDVQGRAHLETSTKTGKARVVPISARCAEILSKIARNSSFVFTDQKGKFIHPVKLRQAWREACVATGIDKRLYSCRATFITEQVLKHGHPIARVAQWVGNSPTVLERHYLGQLDSVSVTPG